MKKQILTSLMFILLGCLSVYGNIMNGSIYNLKWVYDDTSKELVFSFEGEKDYAEIEFCNFINPGVFYLIQPNKDLLNTHLIDAKKIVFAEGMTSFNIMYQIFGFQMPELENCESVVCPSTFKSINRGEFRVYPNLKNIELPDDLEYIGEDAFQSTALYDNDANWTNSALYIGKHLIAVKELTWDDSETFVVREGTRLIAEYAFGSRNENVKSIKLPNSITSINENAFRNTSFYRNKTNWSNGVLYCGKYLIKVDNEKTGTLTIKEGTTVIADNAFSSCEISSVSFPASITRIGKYAFESSKITSIVIPLNITRIAEGTFEKCNELTSVTLNNVSHIGTIAFRYCGKLTSITLPNNLVVIEPGTFERCGDLISISVPESVRYIGTKAFCECEHLTYVTLKENIKQIGTGAFGGTNIQQITLPESIRYIGNSAFDGCTKLSRITIPTSLRNIGTFRHCSSLQEIQLPDSLEKISQGMFTMCEKLTSISIPANVRIIGESAFELCENLTTITLPDHLESIGNEAFGGCEKISTVISTPFKFAHLFPASSIQNIYIADDADMNAFNRTDYPNLQNIKIGEGVKHLVPGFYQSSEQEIVVPNHIQYIDDKAFQNMANLTSVTLPEGVISIGREAFANSKISKINIPANVEIISENAFDNCTFLSEITVDAQNAKYASIDGVLYNKSITKLLLFPYNKQVEQFIVLPSVQDIEEGAFSRNSYPSQIICSFATSKFFTASNITELSFANSNELLSFDGDKFINLKSVILNEGITILPANIFSHISSLKNIVLPNSLTEIGESAFLDCAQMEAIDLPSSVKIIGKNAFYGCTGLKTIQLPDLIDSIGSSAFAKCSQLEAINISDMNNHYLTEGGILYNKEKNTILLFPAGKQEAIFELPASITSIEENAFSFNEKIETIVFSKSLISVGNYAFANCSNIKNVSFPKALERIGDNAFENCLGLISIDIPKSVTIIGNKAFLGCSNLHDVKIRGKLAKMTIGEDVFPETAKISAR